jgi:hypothetical protein
VGVEKFCLFIGTKAGHKFLNLLKSMQEEELMGLTLLCTIRGFALVVVEKTQKNSATDIVTLSRATRTEKGLRGTEEYLFLPKSDIK